jgi:M3 family oligoendopeptidase
MKFTEYQYVRPDMPKIKAEFENLLNIFDNAAVFEEQDKVMEEINRLRAEFESRNIIVYIRHTIDTNDKFYDDEQTFFDNVEPEYQGLVARYYDSLTTSKFKDELKNKWGEQLFNIAELKKRTFSPEVVEDLQEENRLQSEYEKLSASAAIMFEGEERNLSGMRPFMMSRDRETRKKAFDSYYSFFEKNEGRFDEIYDGMVKVRTRIAKKLGFENFIPLAYARLMRSDYGPEMVSSFRRQVKEYIVPEASNLIEKQAARLGVDKIKYYDEYLMSRNGNPAPKGDPDWIVEQGKRMYGELSEETKVFFDYMIQNDLMDLINRKGKADYGYSDYISILKAPYIFSCFNGTMDDINVLTHEAGHAFQSYCSMDFKVPEYFSPTYDACEIHSMSMELLTWSWMELFFGEDADKYRFFHMNDALIFIPYGVTVDEFQHFVYENPDITPEERKKAWREIEKKYLPHRDYDGNEYLERGGYFYRQSHIFMDPFYYIDYTLARVCSFQFWKKANEDREKAWEDYLRLCRAGGSLSFLKLVKAANILSPFDEGCIRSIIGDIRKWIESIDDTEM